MLHRVGQLALILCLLLTSTALGIARGTVSVDGKLVLCTGEGVVVVTNPDGSATTSTHICPDMALSLLSAIFDADMALPPRYGTDEPDELLATARADLPVPVPSARAPPNHQIV